MSDGLPPRFTMGDSLVQRVAFAVWEWWAQKRDLRLLRRALVEVGAREALRRRMRPGTSLLLRFLEEFANSTVSSTEFRFSQFDLTCEGPLRLMMPMSEGMQWARLLYLTARRGTRHAELDRWQFEFRTDSGAVVIECSGPKLTADPRKCESLEVFNRKLEEDAKLPFLVFRKVPSSE